MREHSTPAVLLPVTNNRVYCGLRMHPEISLPGPNKPGSTEGTCQTISWGEKCPIFQIFLTIRLYKVPVCFIMKANSCGVVLRWVFSKGDL